MRNINLWTNLNDFCFCSILSKVVHWASLTFWVISFLIKLQECTFNMKLRLSLLVMWWIEAVITNFLSDFNRWSLSLLDCTLRIILLLYDMLSILLSVSLLGKLMIVIVLLKFLETFSVLTNLGSSFVVLKILFWSQCLLRWHNDFIWYSFYTTIVWFDVRIFLSLLI